MDTAPPLLLETARLALRAQRSPRTEEVYLQWIRRFVRFHGGRHPREMGVREVKAFLAHLSVRGRVAASTESQALAALQFLYREVLGVPLDRGDGLGRSNSTQGRRGPAQRRRGTTSQPATGCGGGAAPQPTAGSAGAPSPGPTPLPTPATPRARLPLVLGPEEVRRLVAELLPPYRAVALLLYGGGLRLGEALRLRIRDLDPEGGRLLVRHRRERRRTTLYSIGAQEAVEEHLRRVRRRHHRDIGVGAGHAPLPDGERGEGATTSREWGWQWVFPSSRIHWDPQTGLGLRHPLHHTAVQRAVREAVRMARLPGRVSCHTLRHSFAARLLEDGYDIRMVQELLGHRSVKTTLAYAPIQGRRPADGPGSARS